MKGDVDQEETTRYDMQKGEDKQTPSGLKELPTYKTIYKIIWNILNAEIPKRNSLY